MVLFYLQDNWTLLIPCAGHWQVCENVCIGHFLQDSVRRTAKCRQGTETVSRHLPLSRSEGVLAGRRPLCQTHVHLPVSRNAGPVHKVETAIT